MKRTVLSYMFWIGLSICFSFYSCTNKLKSEQGKTKSDLSSNPQNGKANGSTLETNLNSLNEFEYYDSIMIEKYNIVLESSNEEIARYSAFSDKTEYNLAVELRKYLIVSQEIWLDSREANAELISKKYEGGHALPVHVNEQRVVDTKARILFFDSLLDSAKHKK